MMQVLAATERPLLFSAPMVRATLKRQKSQTRRTRGLEKVNKSPESFQFERWQDGYKDGRRRAVFLNAEGEPTGLVCPCGAVGDRLWVKETWIEGHVYEDDCPVYDGDGELIERIWYRASDPDFRWYEEGYLKEVTPWKSSMFMPRRASRILLEITDIRVERLQSISSQDALAEGVNAFKGSDFPDPVGAFQSLWESINGKRKAYSWQDNPWVWRISFKVLEPQVLAEAPP